MVRSSLVALVLLASLAPVPKARAVGGHGDLRWGMDPAEVRAALSVPVEHVAEADKAPEGTVGGKLTFATSLAQAPGQGSAFFDASGLALVRVVWDRPSRELVELFGASHREDWGEPIISRRRDRGRVKETWAWPWEGVELRLVRGEDSVDYARVNMSRLLVDDWLAADARLCTLLPSSARCRFAGGHCADSAPREEIEQQVELLGGASRVRCDYVGGALDRVKLDLVEPDERQARWLEHLLLRRLGEPTTSHEDGTRLARRELSWPAHGVLLRVVRDARKRGRDGHWTGPLRAVALRRRVAAAPASATPAGDPATVRPAEEVPSPWGAARTTEEAP